MPATPHPKDWVKSFGDNLYSYALLKVGNRETAEDLVQETFVAALKAVDTFHGESSEKTWLTAILKNKIIDYYRKKDVLKNTSEYIAQTEDDFSKHFFDRANGHWLRDSAPGFWTESADSALNQNEFQQVLLACIHKMPPKLVLVFMAKFIDDEDSETICKVHSLTSSNYWVVVHRAKVLIRGCLEQNWFTTRKSK